MSIIQQHTSASLSDAWRTVNIDALNEDSAVNFDTSTLHPPQPEITEADVRSLSGQVRQLLRGGDAEGALRGSLEQPVYNGTDAAKVSDLRRNLEGVTPLTNAFQTQDAQLQTIIEVLQSIKASEMTPLLKRIYESDGGNECLDVLMKYMYVVPGASMFDLYPLLTTSQLQGHGCRTKRRQPPHVDKGHAAIDGRLQPGWLTPRSFQRACLCDNERAAQLAREAGGSCRYWMHLPHDDGLASGVEVYTGSAAMWLLDEHSNE